MATFDNDRYYRTRDPELAVLGRPGTLAQWRNRGEGPRYRRFGNRILYLGADLNEWLDACIVEPKAQHSSRQPSHPSP